MHQVPISFIRDANRDAGGHFFDDGNVAFMDSRVESQHALYNPQTEQAFFVTSETLQGRSLRVYKVRRFDDVDGRIRTVSDRPFTDSAAAFALAQQLAAQSPALH